MLGQESSDDICSDTNLLSTIHYLPSTLIFQLSLSQDTKRPLIRNLQSAPQGSDETTVGPHIQTGHRCVGEIGYAIR